MGFVIDSNVIINAERNRSRLIDSLQDSPDSDCFLSVISFSELLHGIERATDPAIRRTRTLFLDSIFSRFRIIPIDEETGRVHSIVWADLAARGEIIGQHDLWIAATCLRMDTQSLQTI